MDLITSLLRNLGYTKKHYISAKSVLLEDNFNRNLMAEGTFKKIVRSTDYKLSSFSARLSAYLIVVCLPQKRWYNAAYNTSFFLSFFSKQVLLGNFSHSYQRAFSLNRLLSLITRTGKPYAIPISIIGIEHLKEQQHGLVICTTHLPLVKAGVGALLDNDFIIDAALAALPSGNGLMSFWGTSKLVQSLKTDSSVLLKTKTIIKEKGCILAMIDSGQELWKPISPNLLHFCGKVGSRVVFLFVTLTEKRSVAVRAVPPPYPFCKTEEDVAVNVAFMRKERNEILMGYKLKPKKD